MGKKLAIGLTCTLLGAGVLGGICYQDIPAFKTGVNRFFKNASNISISINKDTDSINENEVKPITPQEFLKTYKVELPTSFLGGPLYVKKLSNNNLIISSSTSTNVLVYNFITKTSTENELGAPNWRYFKELPNGDCLMSSTNYGTGLVLYKADDNSFNKITDKGYYYTSFCELANGEFMAYGRYSTTNGSSYYSYWVHFSRTEFIAGKTNTKFYDKFYPLANGNCFLNSSSEKGLYLYNITDNSFTMLLTTGYNWNICKVGDKYLLSSTGLLLYNPLDNSFTTLLESNQYSLYGLPDDTALVSGSGASSVLYRYNPTDNSLTELYTGFYLQEYIPLPNGKVLINPQNCNGTDLGKSVLFDCLTGEVEEVNTNLSRHYTKQLSNGDILFISSSTSYKYIRLYKVETNSVKTLLSVNFNKIEELPNGDCLIGGSSLNTLYYYDSIETKCRVLLMNITVVSITAQDDGTYLIKTNEGFDYEYNPETKTIKLVYIVE